MGDKNGDCSTQSSFDTSRGSGVRDWFQAAAAAFTPDVIGGILNIARLAEHPLPLRRSRVRSSLLRRQQCSAVCAEDGTIRAMRSAMRAHFARLRLPASVRRHILLLQSINLHLELILTLFEGSDRRHLTGIGIHKLRICGFAV